MWRVNLEWVDSSLMVLRELWPGLQLVSTLLSVSTALQPQVILLIRTVSESPSTIINIKISISHWCHTLLCVSRWGGKEPPAVHPPGHCWLSPHLLPGLLWCFGCPHPHDALLPAQRPQPAARRLHLHWLGGCQIRCGSGLLVCPVDKVKLKIFSVWL